MYKMNKFSRLHNGKLTMRMQLLLNRYIFKQVLTLWVFSSVIGCQSQTVNENFVVTDNAVGQAVIVAELTPVGSVIAYAGDVQSTTREALASQGWLLCDGGAVDRLQYPGLYRVLGTTHGYGDNRRTFNLPDYRGLFLRGVSGASGRDLESDSRTASGTGGLAGNAVGSLQKDSVALHTHTDVGHVGVSSKNVVIGSVSTRPGMVETQNAAVEGAPILETRPKNVYVYYLIFAGIQPDS